MKLPKTLYVRWEGQGKEDAWLNSATVADQLLEDATDEKTVGVYELKKMVTVKSTVSISVQEKTSSRKRSK